MKIKMLKSTPGALNGGLNVKLFRKDLVYDVADMEGIDKVFLKIGVAEVYETPVEVVRHQKGLSGAPLNKREKVPENKEVQHILDEVTEDLVDPDDGDDFFTLEELEGAKAGDIRKLAVEHDIDLTDLPKNTSAKVLINAYLDRQGQ